VSFEEIQSLKRRQKPVFSAFPEILSQVFSPWEMEMESECPAMTLWPGISQGEERQVQP
jgi:hypothetical protein